MMQGGGGGDQAGSSQVFDYVKSLLEALESENFSLQL